MPSETNRKLTRAAGAIMLAFVLSQILGLVRRALIGSTFPAADLEAFIAANRVSETLFNLIAGGALGSAFIPTFTGLLAKQQRAAAWQLASGTANLLLLILSLLAILAGIFAEPIVRYGLAPGLATNPTALQLTINLLRIQLASAVLFGLSGLVMGILNAHQVFFIPALTPSMYQLGMIFGTLVLAPHWGIYGLAWGVVLGATLHLTLQLPALLQQRGKYTQTLGLHDPNIAQVLRLMAPRLFGVAVVHLNFWVNIALASYMAKGSLLGLDYGFATMIMAQAALAQSVATALMPTLSAQYALGQLTDVRQTLANALRGVLLLALPASAGLMLLRVPIIGLLYGRNQFDEVSIQMTAWALLWYATGLVAHAALEVLARTFYALRDTFTPVRVGIFAMLLNVGFSFAFSRLFRALGWLPHGGLALANSLATALESAILFILMRRRLNGIHLPEVLRGGLRGVLATLGMCLALWGWLSLPGLGRLAQVAGGVTLGAAAYLLGLVALQAPEVWAAIHWGREKLRERKS